MDLNSKQLRRLGVSRNNLVEALKQFTVTENVSMYQGDLWLTFFKSKTKPVTKEGFLSEYRAEIAPLVETIKLSGSVETFVDNLIAKMKKFELDEKKGVWEWRYVSVPMTKRRYLILKLRITKEGHVVGYVEYRENRKAGGFRFMLFYQSILEANGLLDPEIDYWPL